MSSALHGPGVVPRGDDDGRDAVHDPFVVCRAAVRVDGGQGIRIQDRFDDLWAGDSIRGQCFGRKNGSSASQSVHREIRDDAKHHAPPRDACKFWGEGS